jgi:hypothetical protein
MYSLPKFTVECFEPVKLEDIPEPAQSWIGRDFDSSRQAIIGHWIINHDSAQASIVTIASQNQFVTLQVVDIVGGIYAGDLEAGSEENPDGMVVSGNSNEEFVQGYGIGTRRIIIANTAARIFIGRSVRSFTDAQGGRSKDADKAWNRLVDASLAEKLTITDTFDGTTYTQYRFI